MDLTAVNLSLISPAEMLAIYGVLVLLASLAGGWLLIALQLSHSRLQLAVSFVAGLMLGMALLHFLPHGFHQLHSLEVIVRWVLVGFLAMFFLQRFLPYHHHDVQEPVPACISAHGELENHDEIASDPGMARHAGGQLSWAATTAGMSLHSLTGGVALAAALAADVHGQGGLLGLGTALVIILHKPFDAMAVATLMTASGCSHFSRHLINSLFALVTPLGMVLSYLGISRVAGADPAIIGGALAFCAGTFLCIACADLLPELQFHSHDRIKLSLALLAGIGIAVLVGLCKQSSHHSHVQPFQPVKVELTQNLF